MIAMSATGQSSGPPVIQLYFVLQSANMGHHHPGAESPVSSVHCDAIQQSEA